MRLGEAERAGHRHQHGRHLQMRNVTSFGDDSAAFHTDEKAVIGVISNTDVVHLRAEIGTSSNPTH